MPDLDAERAESLYPSLQPLAGETGPAAARHLPGRFIFNINFVFFCTLAGNTIGFGVAILLARALGPDGRGVLALFTAAVSIAFAFFNLGIGGAIFYFLARKEVREREAMEAGLDVALIAAMLTAACVIVLALAFEGLLEGRDLPYGLAILAVPLLIQLRVVGSMLRAAGRFGALNLVELTLPLALLVAFGVVAASAGLSVSSAIWGWTACLFVPVALGYAFVGRGVWPRRPAPLSQVVRMVRFGGQNQLTVLIQLLNYRLDVFLILVLVNTSGVGLYTVATSQTEGLWIIADSVVVVLLTNITAGDAANAARMTPLVCRNTVLITAVGAIGAALIAGLWIPAVFGSAYQGSVLPYLWLLPGTVAFSGAKVLAAYVFSRGRPIINAWIALATMAVSVPATVALTHLFGVPGAAAGTSLGYGVNLALSALAYRALSGRPVAEALLPHASDAGLYVSGARSALRRLRGRRPAETHANP